MVESSQTIDSDKLHGHAEKFQADSGSALSNETDKKPNKVEMLGRLINSLKLRFENGNTDKFSETVATIFDDCAETKDRKYHYDTFTQFAICEATKCQPADAEFFAALLFELTSIVGNNPQTYAAIRQLSSLAPRTKLESYLKSRSKTLTDTEIIFIFTFYTLFPTNKNTLLSAIVPQLLNAASRFTPNNDCSQYLVQMLSDYFAHSETNVALLEKTNPILQLKVLIHTYLASKKLYNKMIACALALQPGILYMGLNKVELATILNDWKVKSKLFKIKPIDNIIEQKSSIYIQQFCDMIEPRGCENTYHDNILNVFCLRALFSADSDLVVQFPSNNAIPLRSFKDVMFFVNVKHARSESSNTNGGLREMLWLRRDFLMSPECERFLDNLPSIRDLNENLPAAEQLVLLISQLLNVSPLVATLFATKNLIDRLLTKPVIEMANEYEHQEMLEWNAKTYAFNDIVFISSRILAGADLTKVERKTIQAYLSTGRLALRQDRLCTAQAFLSIAVNLCSIGNDDLSERILDIIEPILAEIDHHPETSLIKLLSELLSNISNSLNLVQKVWDILKLRNPIAVLHNLRYTEDQTVMHAMLNTFSNLFDKIPEALLSNSIIGKAIIETICIFSQTLDPQVTEQYYHLLRTIISMALTYVDAQISFVAIKAIGFVLSKTEADNLQKVAASMVGKREALNQASELMVNDVEAAEGYKKILCAMEELDK